MNIFEISLFVMIGALLGASLPFYIEHKINSIREREKNEKKDTEQIEEIILYRKNIKDFILLGAVNGIIYGVLYYIYGITTGLFLYCACLTLLLALEVIDWNTYEIPLGINACIFILGLINVGLHLEQWSLYVIGFFAVSGFLYLLYWFSGGAWIGGGDVKLMAAAGLLLGWKLILVAFVVGCVLGSIIHLTIMAIHKGERVLAFGPYLSLGIIISMIWGEQLASWYLSLLKI